MAAGQRFSHSIRTRLALDEVGNWALDRADGTITHDFSGWDNHGTIHLGTGGNTNLAAAFVPGVHGQAMSFDGVDDRVNVPHTDILEERVFGISTVSTLEAWAHPITWINWASIVHKSPGNCSGNHTIGMSANDSSGFVCTMGAGLLPPDCNPPGSNINITNRPPLNRWYHIVCTADGARLRMFINGIQIGAGIPIANITVTRRTTTAPIIIGRNGISDSFNGHIDEVRIFSAAVPMSYIQKRYVEGVKSLASNGGITQEEKEMRIAELRNSGQLVIDLDAALAGPIDFSVYNKYLETLAFGQ